MQGIFLVKNPQKREKKAQNSGSLKIIGETLDFPKTSKTSVKEKIISRSKNQGERGSSQNSGWEILRIHPWAPLIDEIN